METAAKLSRKQDLAIVALLAHRTMAEAAASVGVGEVTIWRWMQDENFRAAYREVKRQAVTQAVAQIAQAATEAVTVLREVMQDGQNPASARVSAARAILDAAMKNFEMEDIERRLEILEAKLGGPE